MKNFKEIYKKFIEIFKKFLIIVKNILIISVATSVYLFIIISFLYFVYLIFTWNMLYTIKVALFLDSIFYPLIGKLIEFEAPKLTMTAECVFFALHFTEVIILFIIFCIMYYIIFLSCLFIYFKINKINIEINYL